jgi:hypothetical protein
VLTGAHVTLDEGQRKLVAETSSEHNETENKDYDTGNTEKKKTIYQA